MSVRVQRPGLGTDLMWYRHADTKWILCTHVQGSGRARVNKNVEKGAVVTWGILYSGDREKGTRTTTPNHADKTACVTQQSRGSRQEAWSGGENST